MGLERILYLGVCHTWFDSHLQDQGERPSIHGLLLVSLYVRRTGCTQLSTVSTTWARVSWRTGRTPGRTRHWWIYSTYAATDGWTPTTMLSQSTYLKVNHCCSETTFLQLWKRCREGLKAVYSTLVHWIMPRWSLELVATSSKQR